MHSKYRDLLEPIYRAYALEVDAAAPADVQTLAKRRDDYNEGSEAHEHTRHTAVAHRDFSIVGRSGEQIAVRSYSPTHSFSPDKLTVYLHGGGWVLGNLDTHQQICMDLCHLTGSQVLAIDYRLAPEYPFPAALHDCIDAINHITGEQSEPHLNIKTLVLSGDSAGANLAAACCLSDEITRGIDGLAMIYPGLGASAESASFIENEFAPVLPLATLKAFFTAYLGGEPNNITPLNAPLTAESFSSIPDCYITAALHDPLCDDAIAFDNKMREQDRACQLSIEEGLGHGYLRVRHDSIRAKEAFEKTCAAINGFHSHSKLRG